MSQETNKDQDPKNQQESAVEAEENSQSEAVKPTDAEIESELLQEAYRGTEADELQQQLNSSNEQLLRLQAEMQNVRRRAERDVEGAHKYALEKFATELLSVVDNLERALSTIDAEDAAQKVVAEGLELTLKTFSDVLSRFNIEAVDPAGEPFDAGFHQAVSMQPNPEVEPNTVIEVFQKGYCLNGRLIRPAMVVVATSS
ncbi:MAG: nucleotide exchange factor GrpE [Porticoccaceae bacterium]|nr:nucleotide exchange factor GrpE [Porticoccaceae bacterium]